MTRTKQAPQKPAAYPPCAESAGDSPELAALARLGVDHDHVRIAWDRVPFDGDGGQWKASIQQRLTSVAVLGIGRTPKLAVEALARRLHATHVEAAPTARP